MTCQKRKSLACLCRMMIWISLRWTGGRRFATQTLLKFPLTTGTLLFRASGKRISQMQNTSYMSFIWMDKWRSKPSSRSIAPRSKAVGPMIRITTWLTLSLTSLTFQKSTRKLMPKNFCGWLISVLLSLYDYYFKMMALQFLFCMTLASKIAINLQPNESPSN